MSQGAGPENEVEYNSASGKFWEAARECRSSGEVAWCGGLSGHSVGYRRRYTNTWTSVADVDPGCMLIDSPDSAADGGHMTGIKDAPACFCFLPTPIARRIDPLRRFQLPGPRSTTDNQGVDDRGPFPSSRRPRTSQSQPAHTRPHRLPTTSAKGTPSLRVCH
jgi:hypothetical protein